MPDMPSLEQQNQKQFERQRASNIQLEIAQLKARVDELRGLSLQNKRLHPDEQSKAGIASQIFQCRKQIDSLEKIQRMRKYDDKKSTQSIFCWQHPPLIRWQPNVNDEYRLDIHGADCVLHRDDAGKLVGISLSHLSNGDAGVNQIKAMKTDWDELGKGYDKKKPLLLKSHNATVNGYLNLYMQAKHDINTEAYHGHSIQNDVSTSDKNKPYWSESLRGESQACETLYQEFMNNPAASQEQKNALTRKLDQAVKTAAPGQTFEEFTQYCLNAEKIDKLDTKQMKSIHTLYTSSENDSVLNIFREAYRDLNHTASVTLHTEPTVATSRAAVTARV